MTGAWYVWQKNHRDTPKKPSSSNSASTDDSQNNQQSDPSEGGKYLYLEEWNLRAALPSDLQSKVTYSLGSKVTDPDGNQIQAAKVLLKNDLSADNECATTTINETDFIDSAAQLLQVEKGKPFDTDRYKGTFKANLLTDTAHTYHLNYITPDCASPSATRQIEELQSALAHLEHIE